MPFRSPAQRLKLITLAREGKFSPATLQAWTTDDPNQTPKPPKKVRKNAKAKIKTK